jgi:hypothetical protein
MLTASDFTYLGASRMPLPPSGPGSYAYGAMTVRTKTDGTKTLLIDGPPNMTPAVSTNLFELSLGPFDPDPTTARRATLIKSWGDVWGATRQPIAPSTPAQTEGMLFDPATQTLFWTFGGYYDVDGVPRPVLGATQLYDDGHYVTAGPWSVADDAHTDVNRHRVRQYLVKIPDDFAAAYTGGRKLGLGAGLEPGNGAASWGPDLYAVAAPGMLDAPGSLPSTPCVGYTAQNRCTRPGNYIVPYNALCVNVPGKPDVPGCVDGPGNNIPPSSPQAGLWTSVDWVPCAASVITENVAGMVFLGAQARGAVWYGHWQIYDQTSGALAYTSDNPNTKGEQAQFRDPFVWLYDWNDMAKVALGVCQPWQIVPSSTFNLGTLSPMLKFGTMCQLHGAYFDPDTSRLYVSAWQAERYQQGTFLPIVYAFGIA